MSRMPNPTPDAHAVDIQWGVPRAEAFPTDTCMNGWIVDTLVELAVPTSEVSVRLMGEAEIEDLNSRFRQQQKTTNVLSFPSGDSDESGRRLLGDVAVCVDVIVDEARDQGKSVEAHLAHMLVHGVLHLCGFDHIDNDEAETMENLERKIVANFGFPDPYNGPVDKEGNDHE